MQLDQKIQTKEQALNLLDRLDTRLDETILFLTRQEMIFFQLAKQQLRAIKNSINHSDDFFSSYFEDKTEEDIINWIEKEAQKW